MVRGLRIFFPFPLTRNVSSRPDLSSLGGEGHGAQVVTFGGYELR